MLSPDVTSTVRMAARHLSEAREREQQLEHERPAKKMEAIERIMQHPNALTGKPHSYSSAEAIVETDTEYAAYLATQRMATSNVIRARAEYEIAVATMKSDATFGELAA